MRNRKVRKKVGDVVRIELEDGDFCFGRVLEFPIFAFYDLKTQNDENIEKIVELPVLFKICVMDYAVTSGRWPVMGNIELDAGLREPVVFFKEDMISGQLSLYVNSTEPVETPATRGQCFDLERAAVWDPEHVEDRLRDHYLGVPNAWVESLRLK